MTTPDLLDFFPAAEHLPFFPPTLQKNVSDDKPVDPDKRILFAHITNQPGIEGTQRIREAIDNVRREGINVELKVISGVSHKAAMSELASADASIGKLKMGYYANAQIESLVLGVPSICWIREDLMAPGLADGALLIFDNLMISRERSSKSATIKV